MENKEVMIVRQAVLKATVHLVGDLFKDNSTPQETVNDCLFMADQLYDWVIKDTGTAAVTTKENAIAKNDDPVGFEPKCPACGSFVWDNRETASNNQPKWRCKNEECTGGTFSKKYNRLMAWASWESDEFANAGLKANRVEDKVEKVNGVGVVDDTDTTPPF